VLADQNQHVLVAEITAPDAAGGLQPGDQILALRGDRLADAATAEFLTDFRSVGDTVDVATMRLGAPGAARIVLIPAHPWSYIVIVCFVGILTWFLGIFVLVSRPDDPTAAVLHWSMISMAVVVVTAFEDVPPGSLLGYASSLLFFLSYAGIAVSFFLFTTLFPRPKLGPFPLKLIAIALPVCVLTAFMVANHYQAIRFHAVEAFGRYRVWFSLFHILLFLLVGGGIINFIHSFLTAKTGEEKRKLKWILLGLCLGPTPFLILVILPQILLIPPQVNEEYTLIFLLVIPLAFAISFVRYHLLDVEVVINRTTVYGIVMSMLLVLYVLLVGGLAELAGTVTVGPSAVAAVLVALLFEPARTRVQRFVDKRFFRVRYDFREAERRFVEQIKRCLDLQQLAGLIVAQTGALIPVERIAFVLLRQPGNRLSLLAHENFDLLMGHSVRFEPENLRTRLQLPIALDDRVESGIPHESADETMFRRWGLAVVFPMISGNLGSIGFVVLGAKKSGGRFGIEDIDLLNNVATQTGLEVERMLLQQELLNKKEEAEKLEELSRVKSDFVSYVSHELRTPLTSIKMFTDLLRNRAASRDIKTKEYLDVIDGETGRLSRMITTILDSARIDQGVQHYTIKDADLGGIVGKVMETMKYQLTQHRFRVEWRPPQRKLPCRADSDAVAQAMINLIANAIKYSGDIRYIKVTIARRHDWLVCRVEDRGFGIPPSALPHLFEKFYRDASVKERVQGVGLGLPLVKHIMDAHGGKVEVDSALGRGSVFRLLFPTMRIAS
jgi:signal transduction histidine kinase